MQVLSPPPHRTEPAVLPDQAARVREDLVVKQARVRARRRRLATAGIVLVAVIGVVSGLVATAEGGLGSTSARTVTGLRPVHSAGGPVSLPTATPVGLGFGCTGADEQQVAYLTWHSALHGLDVSVAQMLGSPLRISGIRSGSTISFPFRGYSFSGAVEGNRLLLTGPAGVISSVATTQMTCVLESFATWHLGVPVVFANQVGAAARGYPTCKQLGVIQYGDRYPPGVPPAAAAIAHGALTAITDRSLTGPEVDLVESGGPAACASAEFPNTSGTEIYGMMSPSLTPSQASALETNEASYLRRTQLFRPITLYADSTS
jgi:hypothetical protein